MVHVDRPLIVQGDFTLLLELDHPAHDHARDALARFCELVKAPEYVHTYRLTPLSIWNAAAAGMTGQEMLSTLESLSRYPVPGHIRSELLDMAGRFGKLRLVRHSAGLALEVDDPTTADLLMHHSEVAQRLGERVAPALFVVEPLQRGRLKQALIKVGYPAHDLAGYTEGEPLDLSLRAQTLSGAEFSLRPYQQHAVASFYSGGGAEGGSGVVVLPCGAGKTVVAMGILSAYRTSTLILTPGVTAARQWIHELLDKTSLAPEDVGEYTGESKEVRPVTVTTYQTLTHRASEGAPLTHFGLFDRRPWGLVVYDEVHLLPAPVFQITAELQARRRLGLTATLIREDGRQDDVFALIGPRKYDVPWKEMERQGWIARAECVEVRVPLTDTWRRSYSTSPERHQFRVACENPAKTHVVRQLLARHQGAPALVIGTYVEQLERLSEELGAPLLTGKTPQKKRDALFEAFRRAEIPALVVSRVANFAVDLPDAAVAIQVSGSFGSRQEEAQRLGRLLRPKKGENQAHFYAIVSADTVEQDIGLHRQLFLVEQGYRYSIEDFHATHRP